MSTRQATSAACDAGCCSQRSRVGSCRATRRRSGAGAAGSLAVARLRRSSTVAPSRTAATILAIDAPYRAEDAALVPVASQPAAAAGDARRIVGITLVIDENPSPLAAVFTPGHQASMRSLSTRVRVDSYTNVTAVAELSDGQLYAAAAVRQGRRRLLGACREAGGRLRSRSAQCVFVSSLPPPAPTRTGSRRSS